MSLHDDLLTAAAYLEGDGVSMEAAEADRIAGVFRSYATALCQQGERDAKDAARYRWLRDRRALNNRWPHITVYPWQDFDGESPHRPIHDRFGYHPERLDEWIDAAMTSEGKTE